MTNPSSGFFGGPKIKSVSFEKIGDTVTGTIEELKQTQQSDMKGVPKTYQDGRPMMQLVITLQTGMHQDDDDDGQRNLYCKWKMRDAIRDALEQSGVEPSDGLEIGSTLTVTKSGEEPTAFGTMSNLYSAKYVRGGGESRTYFDGKSSYVQDSVVSLDGKPEAMPVEVWNKLPAEARAALAGL